MTIDKLQKSVDSWIQDYGIRYFSELTNMAILTEEVGELARLISRMFGEQSFKNPISEDEQKQMLADEMADVLWVLTCLANQTGVDLTIAVEKNFKKKSDRDVFRHKQNKKLK